jgi:hypothetical protein
MLEFNSLPIREPDFAHYESNAVKQRVAASVCEMVNGRVPVLIGISDAGRLRSCLR